MGRSQHQGLWSRMATTGLRKISMSQHGFSLTELVATVSILAVIALGSTFLFSDLAKVQKRSSIANTISTMRAAIMSAVTMTRVQATFATPWEVTRGDADNLTGNPLMACLRTNTTCTKDLVHRLNLKNSDGSELYYSRTDTRGFDLDGRLCNTFDDVNGNPACPFRWVLTWIPRCVGTDKPSCDNPTIEVNGTLLYRPGNTDILGGTPFNPDVYAFSLRRGEKRNLNEAVIISYVENDATGEAGTCFETWHPRSLNTISRDPGSNAALVGADAFTLQPGAYDCRIQVPAFKNGGNQVRLTRTVGALTGVIATSGIVTAAMTGEAATVLMSVAFSSVGPAVEYRVEHRCSSRPSNQVPFGGSDDAFMLGVPVPDGVGLYGGTTYTTVNCVKTSGL